MFLINFFETTGFSVNFFLDFSINIKTIMQANTHSSNFSYRLIYNQIFT